MNRPIVLQVLGGRVPCPKFEDEEILVDEHCRECLFLKSSNTSGNGTTEGADGVVVCEYIKLKED